MPEPPQPARLAELCSDLLAQVGEDVRIDVRLVDDLDAPPEKAREFLPLGSPEPADDRDDTAGTFG